MENKEKNITISAAHFELTEAIKNHVHEQCEKLFHHSNDIISIDVKLGNEHGQKGKPTWFASGKITIFGPDLVSKATNENLYASISDMTHQLDRLLRKKYKKQEARKHSA